VFERERERKREREIETEREREREKEREREIDREREREKGRESVCLYVRACVFVCTRAHVLARVAIHTESTNRIRA